MKNIGHALLYIFLRTLVWLRYRLHVKGFEQLGDRQGIVFLPNHPAEIDPLILILVLWPKYKPHPLVVEHFYYQKFLKFFLDCADSIPLPNMDLPNQWKAKQLEKLKTRIVQGVKKRENFLLYPSGKLKMTPDEQIGGASMTHELLKENRDLPIVLVRTTGLWGSLFSRALKDETPNFMGIVKKAIFIILKNAIFFTPRRDVTIEFEWAGEDFPRKAERLELNRYLENWYNRYPLPGPELIKLVSFAFWKKELPKVKKVEKKAEEAQIDPEIKQEIITHLAQLAHTTEDKIQPEVHLSNELGLDSLDLAQLAIFLEHRFDIRGIFPGQLQTVNDLYLASSGELEGMQETAPLPKKRRTWKHPQPFVPQIAEGETLQEVFLRSCARMGSAPACADSLSGILSYRKFKQASFILSLKIRTLPGDQIGVLLPASCAAYIVVIAILLAGKKPVMLNWTAGPRNLEHSAKLCHLKVVLSSFRFLSRVEGGDFGNVDDLLLLLEDVRPEISFSLKLKGLALSHCWKRHLKKLRVSPDDTAVTIFTSGTETLPKGVPLTHRNLLSNQRAAVSCVKFYSKDILFGVLPPFHSFGLSVTGLVPLFMGLKVCFSPDPTDSRAMAREIAHWKPTLFCCAPSFIQNLLEVAKRSDLASLRLIVTGAEKAPDELFETFEKMNKKMIEGYGVSECSPIVTLEREFDFHKGVGKPIPGCELLVIDPETEELMLEGEEGEICIAGPSVFGGYLGHVHSPFITLKGKTFYRSGDRGKLDSDGTLILTGRLKRFVKIGGEMVSLGGMEEDLKSLAKGKKGTAFAVVAKGQESGKPEIILYTSIKISREEVNQFLQKQGHSRLAKISTVIHIDEIPLTGTGKVHYRLLESMDKPK